MSARVTVIGINVVTRTVDAVGECTAEEVLQMLGAGQIVLPATEDQCRTLWGMRIPDPYTLHTTDEATPIQHQELDAAGQVKQPLNVLESMAVDACNRVKAWAESDRTTPFPEHAHMLADGVLMMAAQRRKGVR